MASLDQLRRILEERDISSERKADLINKYKVASPILKQKMNDYFGIINREQQEIKSEYNKPDTKAYYGSNARNIDHRERPTPDLHLESDKALDNEYFKNSK